MATRFGASSPAQTYATKVRWLVGFLVAVIGILVFSLFLLAQGGGKAGEGAIAEDSGGGPEGQALAPTVKILYAAQRIEHGVQITDSMLLAQPVPTERMPEGAIKELEKGNVVNQWTTGIISANIPILKENITQTKPFSQLNIPVGYRAVTIEVSARSGVSGWAKPNSRVDVLWAYTDRNKQKKVATIVRFAKVLSIGGSNQAGESQGAGPKGSTATLLVTKREAKKIELARTLGTLSLSLVGAEEEVVADADGTDIVDINDILGVTSDVGEKVEEPTDGTMYVTDPKTGKKQRYILRNNRWVPDSSYPG